MLVARRNLLRDRARFALSLGGVAVSVALMLLLAGYRAGVYEQSTAYLRNSPGTLVVAERGIANFLGTSSVLPSGTEQAVRALPDVARAVPVVSQFVIFERHDRKDGFFLIGYDPALGGGPWQMVAGREPAVGDELVLDRVTARQHDIGVGDAIDVLDRQMKVVGLSEGTTFWAGSIAFAPITTLESLLRSPGIRSFLLVTPNAGVDEGTITRDVGSLGADIVTKERLIANDRSLMARVYDAPVGLMVGVAFVVGVLVVGLVTYTATVERRREYAALKAIGIANRLLYRIVGAQALIAAVIGGVAGTVLAYAGAFLLMLWRPQFLVTFEPSVVVVALTASVLMAGLAALAPSWSLARVAPAEGFHS